MEESTHTDEQLVAMIQSGGDARKTALKRIYLSSFRAAKGRILNLRGTAYEVEDAVTEAIIILDNHIRNGKYKQMQGVPLKSYFLGICYWQWRSMKDSRLRTPPTADYFSIEGQDFKTPEVLMLENDQKKLVRQLLDDETLGEGCRETLKLYALSYSLEEIAQKMDFTYDYAKQKVFRCRNKLREILEKHPSLMKQLLETL